MTSPNFAITIGSMSSDSSNVSPGMTVEDCPLHVDMVITAIDIDERHRFRMLELGLRRGTVIRVNTRQRGVLSTFAAS